jgi:ApbE superfamily uncharacterized protein (UPF0280 family)
MVDDVILDYRKGLRPKDLCFFQVRVKQTDLWVSAVRDLTQETRDLVFECRHQLETYIETHPEFAAALTPWEDDPYAPSLVKEMIAATRSLGIGPMACVAGAIAQWVGTRLLEYSEQIIVENGGDIFLKRSQPAKVVISGGASPLSDKLGLLIPLRQMPLGVCSSSGTVGHSLSLGISDVITVLAPSAALADATATALGNRIKKKKDLQKVAEWAGQIRGILGGVAIVGDVMASWGDIELTSL